MSAQNFKYIKLPGTGYRSVGAPLIRFLLFFVIGFFVLLLRGKKVQLWLGDDHLLVVDSNGYTEDYKRFYFKDIQGISWRKTVEGKAINFVLALPMVVFGAFGVSSNTVNDGLFFYIVTGIFLVLLIINLVRGPTCEAELFTAVQTEKLVSLNRIKTMRKFLGRVQPLVIAAQGELKAEEMHSQPTSTESNPVFSRAYEVLPVPETPYRSKIHLYLAWVALADVVGTAVVTFMGPDFSRLYTLIHIVTLIILAVMALNKQKNTTLPTGLKRLPVVLIAGVVGCFLLSIILGIYFTITNQHSADVMRENPLGSPWQVAMMVISTGINGLGGLYGVVNFRRYQQTVEAAVPPTLDPPADSPNMDLPA